MIRVNLLQVKTEEPVRREWLPTEQRNTLLGTVLLVATFVGVGGYWWYLSGQRSTVQTQIDTAQAELVRLQRAAELVEEANRRKGELSERLTLIDRLRAGKRGPVTLLETVSRSIPEGLWLLELSQKGTTVTMDGRALSLTAVTDFAQRMQNSGFFQRPVEIRSTLIEVVEETPVVRFSVQAEAVTPTVESSASVSAAGAPAPTPSVPSSETSSDGMPPQRPGA